MTLNALDLHVVSYLGDRCTPGSGPHLLPDASPQRPLAIPLTASCSPTIVVRGSRCIRPRNLPYFQCCRDRMPGCVSASPFFCFTTLSWLRRVRRADSMFGIRPATAPRLALRSCSTFLLRMGLTNFQPQRLPPYCHLFHFLKHLRDSSSFFRR